MNYVLLIYSSPATWNSLSQEERDQMGRDHAAALACYERAARQTGSLPERRYLQARAARLAPTAC